jgi:hypothetical protein
LPLVVAAPAVPPLTAAYVTPPALSASAHPAGTA